MYKSLRNVFDLSLITSKNTVGVCLVNRLIQERLPHPRVKKDPGLAVLPLQVVPTVARIAVVMLLSGRVSAGNILGRLQGITSLTGMECVTVINLIKTPLLAVARGIRSPIQLPSNSEVELKNQKSYMSFFGGDVFLKAHASNKNEASPAEELF